MTSNRGNLEEEHLPLAGWPKKRIEAWRRNVWVCPWFGQAGDLLEPYLFLPSILILAWLFVVLRRWTTLDTGVLLILSVVQQQQLSVYSARLMLLRVQGEQLAQRANLHLALGGSFENPPAQQAQAAKKP